jgi:hypothetical protein
VSLIGPRRSRPDLVGPGSLVLCGIERRISTSRFPQSRSPHVIARCSPEPRAGVQREEEQGPLLQIHRRDEQLSDSATVSRSHAWSGT